MESLYQAIETVDRLERHPPAPGMDKVVESVRKELLHLFNSFQIDPASWQMLDRRLRNSRHNQAFPQDR